MVLSQVNFRGKTITPGLIKTEPCFYFTHGKKIVYPYKLVEQPEYYVAGEGLYSDKTTTHYDDELQSMIFDSLYHFKVIDQSLVIN